MDSFTLIIPTHNRHHYLKRSMEYFKALGADVVYCDSSSEKYEGKIHPNTVYLHLPGQDFKGKMRVVLSEIKTNFVALCADDDFILIDSLHKGLDFLAQNKNYKTTVGKYIGFNEVFDGKFFPIYQNPPEDIDLGFGKNAAVFFKNYYMILWAMYDKKILVKAFQIIDEAKFHNDNYMELVIGACACYEGGIKFPKEIWGIREISDKEHWGNRHAPIMSMKIAQINGDYQKFKELVDKHTFVGCADAVMNSYLNGHTKKTVSLRNAINQLIPEFAKTMIRKIIHRKIAAELVLDKASQELLEPIKLLLDKDRPTK